MYSIRAARGQVNVVLRQVFLVVIHEPRLRLSEGLPKSDQLHLAVISQQRKMKIVDE